MKKELFASAMLSAILLSGCGQISESSDGSLLSVENATTVTEFITEITSHTTVTTTAATTESEIIEPAESEASTEIHTEITQISAPTEPPVSAIGAGSLSEEPEPSEKTTVSEILDIEVPAEDRRAKQIAVKNILQNPELPTGCESVSLTIVLNHLGFPVNKMTIARKYLPKQEFYWSGGVYYGADFRTTFAGDPESEDAYGCYAPCITNTANDFLMKNGYQAKAVNITGTDFDTLLTDYIDRDLPVLIWITRANLHETKQTVGWTTPAGEKVMWTSYEHCAVLTGYDLDSGIIYVSDPLIGNTAYDYGKIKQRFQDMGQQAVCIEP